MFQPVGGLEYQLLEPTAQAIVVACPMSHSPGALRSRWYRRAAAVIGDSSAHVRDVVRDILANPQIRVVVFDGPACGRGAWDAFWLGKDFPDWKMDHEHLALVRQFVELYDDDFGIKDTLQPFWPARILYKE